MPKYGKNGKDFLKYLKNHQAIYNGDTGLKNWKNALNRVKSGSNEKIEVCIVGDSISEGQMANDPSNTGADWQNYYNYGFAGLLRTYYNTKFDDVGTGLIGRNFSFDTATPPIFTETGTWNHQTSQGYGVLQSGAYSTTPGSTLSFDFNGTGVSIYGIKNTSANMDFTVAIDGGSPQTFTEKDISANRYKYTNFNVTGLSAGDHNCVITSGPEFWFAGFREIKGTKGIIFNNFVHGGYDSSKATHARNLSFLSYFQPKLTILSFLSNDYTNQILPTYQSNLQAVITEAQKWGDVLITNINVRTGNFAQPLQSFIDVQKNLAIINNCAFLDVVKVMGGSYASELSKGMVSDFTHFNTLGHQTAYNTILKVLES